MRTSALVLSIALALALGLTAGTAAAQSLTPIELNFDAPAAGTVADRDGEGTGFTSVQANKDGDQYQPGLLDLTGGALNVTTTPTDARSNLQVNALQVSFDADAPYRVSATLRGPVAVTQAFQRGGIFVGVDQDNYVKLVLGVGRSRGAASPHIEMARESGGVFVSAFRPVQDPATISSIDLTLAVNPTTRQVTGSYSINGGSARSAGTLLLPGLPRTGIAAGIITTSDEAPATVISYESFSVQPFGGRLPAFRCGGRLATIVGTSGSDRITGTAAADVIVSLGGRDIVHGRSGNDRLCLGSGNDVGIGGGGVDRIYGQNGNDRLIGGAMRDFLIGGRGRDLMIGGSGNDILAGGAHRDRGRGGSGRDRVRGGGGPDILAGGSGLDRIDGGTGRDRCRQGPILRRCEI